MDPWGGGGGGGGGWQGSGVRTIPGKSQSLGNTGLEPLENH